MLLRIDQLASHVAAHAGVSPPLAGYALRAVVSGIGGHLTPAFRQLVAEELPDPLATLVRSAVDDRTPIEDRVHVNGMTAGQTRELIASVCRVLAEELSNEALQAMTTSLPASVAKLFVPPAPEVHHEPAPLHRQANWVGEPNPHAETKLSSARGTTQEREHETLAEGRPGAKRKISDPN